MLNLTKDNFVIVRNTAKDTSAYQPRCFAFQPAISSALPVAARITLATTPFTGQKFDASDGLMYYGARYYDAALGRFISADTVVPGAGNPQALNRYAYVRNNPVKYVDPTGHRACGGIYEEDCDSPGDIGQPGTGTSPAVTQNDQGPSGSDDACNLARCGGGGPSGNQTPLGQGPTTSPASSNGTFNPRTLSLGATGQIGLGLGFQGDFTLINIDVNGNVQIFSITLEFMLVSGVTANGGGYAQLSNAQDIFVLQGVSGNVGGSAGEGVLAGVDYNFGQNHSYDAIKVSVEGGAVGTPPALPAELHSGISNTWFWGPSFKLW